MADLYGKPCFRAIRERDEALILRAQPTGFLQGTAMLHQVITVKASPILWAQRGVDAHLDKLVQMMFRRFVHGLLLFWADRKCISGNA